MNTRTQITVLNCFIAAVWFINGFVAKVMNIMPRHEAIVADILSEDHSRTLILLIGIAEIIMAIWVLSRWLPRINAITQMLVIGLMNVLEFIFTPELLLWGHLNSLFAFLFMATIFYKAFVLESKQDDYV